MSKHIVENFTEIDMSVGNTQNIVKINNEIFISAMSTHISLDTANNLFGIEEKTINNKKIFGHIARIDDLDVFLITPQEARAYNDGVPLENILLER